MSYIIVFKISYTHISSLFKSNMSEPARFEFGLFIISSSILSSSFVHLLFERGKTDIDTS